MVWGVDCARTFFRWLFLHEKRGLEDGGPKLRDFPQFIINIQEIKKLEGAGTFNPPHYSYIKKPPTINFVSLSISKHETACNT